MPADNIEILKIVILGTSVGLILCVGLITAIIYSQRRFIAEQQKTLNILRESEERFRKLVEETPVPTFVSINGLISYVNAAVLSLMNVEKTNDILGKTIIRFLAPLTPTPIHRKIVSSIEKNKPLSPTILSLLRSDNKLLEVEISAIPILYNNKQAVLIVLLDITETKRAEEALREIPRKIIAAQEEERRRFARELHDGVNQILFNVKGQVETLEKSISLDPAIGISNLAPITDPLKAAMKEIQRISRNLRPSALDELGLASAINSMADEFILRTHISVSVNGFPQERLSSELELAFYRIVQEALNNVEKHSLATQVIIECVEDESSILITITDNGKGIKREQLLTNSSNSGVGLTTMKERAELAGGTLSISSPPGKGTLVTLIVPKPRSYAM